MTICCGDGFLYFYRFVIAIKDGAEHARDRHPLGKTYGRCFLRRRHPAHQVVNRPRYPSPDWPRGIFDERVNAPSDLPGLRDRRPVNKPDGVVAVAESYRLGVGQEDATAHHD